MGSAEGSAGGPRDFFISHASRDQAWAEWLGWQLTEAGYSVELDVWDWAPGQDFVAQMRRALGRAERMLAVYTPAYFAARYTERELHAAFTLGEGRIVPVLVEPCDIPELFRPLVHIDLVGLDEEAAAERLSGGVVVEEGDRLDCRRFRQGPKSRHLPARYRTFGTFRTVMRTSPAGPNC